jgi:DNA-binding NtrC family response regulator
MPTVLVIDDKPNQRGLIIKVLRGDAEVHSASGVAEARTLLDSMTPDVVICDLKMADGTGLDVLRRVREISAEIPFILVSAYATIPTAVEAMRGGAFDCLTKPFDPDQLREVVLRALDTVRAARSAPASPPDASKSLGDLSYREFLSTAREGATRAYLLAVLAKHHGNVTAAAAHAGVERESFHRLLRRHAIRADLFRDEASDAGSPPKKSRTPREKP